jgi:MFS family permease
MRNVRYYVLAGTLVWLAFGAFGALEPLFFRDVANVGIEEMSWVNSIFGVGFVAGAALLARLPQRVISAKGLALAVGLTGLGTVLYVGSSDLRIIATGAFVWALVVGVLEPLLRTLLHRDSPRALVGRVIGVAEVNHRVGEILPLAIAPTLANAFGVRATLIGGGLVATIAAVLTFGEAAAIDRENRARGVPPVEPVGIEAGDEPISPVR